MTKKQKFINFVEDNLFSKVINDTLDPDIEAYWEALKGAPAAEKPMFTDTGKLIMKYVQEHAEDIPNHKAKDIADALIISSRAVSGAIRKLVDDGFIEKIGADPVIYCITEKGKNIKIED